METKFKKTILVDLDGVLNTYNGKYDAQNIPLIKNGAHDFIKELSKEYKVVIFTTRNRFKTSKWIIENNLSEYIDDITNVKEPSYLIVDDRCINFNGDYKETLSKIRDFKVWYKD